MIVRCIYQLAAGFFTKHTHVKFLRVFRNNEKDPLTESEKLAVYRQSGDLGLLGTLYEPYMEMIFAICFKYLKAEDEAKDAVMQLFEKVAAELKTHEVTNLKSWLHTVSRNYCLMQIRVKRTFVTADDHADLIESASIDGIEGDQIDISERHLLSLEKCMATLIREQKLSVELFYLRDKCYREIAAETGFELSKVKSYIQNGKRNLKICMDRNGKY
ncbi:RNA polymerase sigma factor [Dyadobacter aurulentus]|uniref:RNA polymerase sigma factor n=1 Tax=Dyadobacter sp. UC 10 TaxID=2605428 RepID=UPI0011F38DBB|nr:RNA polymerase sigma factor [Dyadobacter sp. UC 10]KAA0993793.1 RNA polymerase sigma factor [Dyadobacter sp. UC 10]